MIEQHVECRQFHHENLKDQIEVCLSRSSHHSEIITLLGKIPQPSLNAINIVLSQSRLINLMTYTNIGKTYFRNDGQVLDLGFGKEVWYGIFSSVRPNSWTQEGTQYLATLNANLVNKVRLNIKRNKSYTILLSCFQAAVKEKLLIGLESYTDEILDIKRTDREGRHWSKGMSKEQVDILQRDLRDLKIRYTLPNGMKREYKCNAIKEPANRLMIPDLNETVEQYFAREHKAKLKFPHLPCLHLGKCCNVYVCRSPRVYIKEQNQGCRQGS